MTTFLDERSPLPYCPGCGHPHVLRALDDALGTLDAPPHRLVLVTDIGCVGLADAYFPTLHTVHALHGRAAAVAAGMQLGERERDRDPLKPVVLVGDGGATIGLLHLVHAAQLDVDVTVLVHNNLVYGMTGGQHSGLTPTGLRTTTTPEGCSSPPLDLQAVLGGAGGGFFARARAPGPDLAAAIAEAVAHPGFACVEILELCPTFAARVGGLTGKALDAMAAERGLRMGVLHRREPRAREVAGAAPDPDPFADAVVPEPAWRRLDRTARVVLAGRAGERVQSAARVAAAAGAAAGLHATVRTENPVTQGRGFSTAEVTLAPERIAFTGLVPSIDAVIVTAAEGLAELAARGLTAPAAGTRWVLDEALEAPAGIDADRRDLRRRYGPKAATLGALVEEVDRTGWWAPAAWEAALATLPPSQRKGARETIARAREGAED